MTCSSAIIWCTENSVSNKECGVHAFPSLIHPFLEWRSLDCLRPAGKRLVCWSKSLRNISYIHLYRIVGWPIGNRPQWYIISRGQSYKYWVTLFKSFKLVLIFKKCVGLCLHVSFISVNIWKASLIISKCSDRTSLLFQWGRKDKVFKELYKDNQFLIEIKWEKREAFKSKMKRK